jgi:molybdopterin converting factor small subunit
MKVTIKLYGILRRYRPAQLPGARHQAFEFDIEDNMSVAQLSKQLGIESGLAAGAAVNGESVQLEAIVREGDIVSFFPPVAGGS